MLVMDLFLWETLGTSSPHIVLSLHLQHLTANISRKDRNSACCAQDGWNKEVPDPVHEPTGKGGVSQPKSFHANHRDVKTRHNEYDKDIGKKEAGNGNEKIREKCGTAVIKAAPEKGRSDPDGKGKGPGQNCTQYEQPQTVQETLPYLLKDRLIVFPGSGLSSKEIAIKIEVLHIKRFIQVKLFAKTLHHLRSKLGIEGVYLAGLSGSQVND